MPGGGAAVGAAYAARQKPDGYTVMCADLGGLIWNPMTQPVTYKISDFRIIADQPGQSRRDGFVARKPAAS